MLSYGHGNQNVSNNMAKMRSLAKAKYDNLAESHDELAFRKGDVLTVVDQKIEGLDGWWVCSFRGKQGIVPANRLTLLAGMYYESALRFSTSPESSISDGGGVDYDIPRHDPQNRKLPPLPSHTKPVLESGKAGGGGGAQVPVRELVYDIPKSLEKTRIHAAAGVSPSQPSNYRSNPEPPTNGVYDSPTQLHILTPAGLLGQRVSGGTLSPLYKSGDSAVDVKSNRSSMMSNNSSPPGSSVCDSQPECTDIYDVPNKLAAHRRVTSKHRKRSEDVESEQRNTNTSFEGYYDVPKTIKETLQEYRDSGIYDNARLSTVQTSPLKDTGDVYDTPIPSRSSIASTRDTPVSDEPAPLYDVLPQAGSVSSSKQLGKADSLDITPEMDRLNLELEAAIEIIVELQQHVHTSSNRLLSFIHARWRQRSNLESVLYDLKIACVGLQSTLQEFYDFGTGALVNSASLADRTVMNRLSHCLVPLKNKLDTVNNSMKSLSSVKWHIAKLEEPEGGSEASMGADGAGGDLMRLMTVAREVSEDVNRVASVIHGNSSLLFKSNTPHSSVHDLLSEARDEASAALRKNQTSSCLVREDTLESYNEYDYCEVTVREEDQPAKQVLNKKTAIDQEQDSQYLRYYLQHVHAICDIVKQHVTRLEDIIESGVESNQTLVTQGKLVVSTAHRLVYIGDTLCRCIKQSNIHMAISDDANILCNVLKDFIMSTKEAALAQPTARAAAFSKLRPNVKSVLRQAESFRNVIQTYAK